MENKKNFADKLLYEYGLWEKLNNLGRAHIIGSYSMDMIVANDLDIDVLNTEMSNEKLYELTKFIINTFKPVWYEAKQEVNDEGKTVWFHGFETNIVGELWNVDIWFFDQETIDKAVAYCDNICEKIKDDLAKKETIIIIKNSLLEKGLYNFENYTSTDVYDAVLNKNISSVDEFLKKVKRNHRP
jgi:hypothetical protein